MPVKKIKSEDYLNYLGSMGCFITKRPNPDIHHESVVRSYSGAMKKYFDFGAIPLSHELHLGERHQIGREGFWNKYGYNPVDICIALVTVYIGLGRPDLELAERALEMLKRDNGYSS